jgi:hypothetical protein
MLHNNECVSPCPTGYVANTAGTACEAEVVTNTTDTTNSTTTTTTTSSGNSYSWIPFPFLIVAMFLFIVALSGCLKDSRSLVSTAFIAMLSPLQFLYYIVQAFHAYRKEETQLMYLTGLALASLIFCNFLFALIF